MSRQSVAKAHQKIQELSWEPQYHEPVSQYGTDYTFHKAQKKDPLKQVLRSYFPMQEEKDHRVYDAEDGAIRGNITAPRVILEDGSRFKGSIDMESPKEMGGGTPARHVEHEANRPETAGVKATA